MIFIRLRRPCNYVDTRWFNLCLYPYRKKAGSYKTGHHEDQMGMICHCRKSCHIMRCRVVSISLSRFLISSTFSPSTISLKVVSCPLFLLLTLFPNCHLNLPSCTYSFNSSSLHSRISSGGHLWPSTKKWVCTMQPLSSRINFSYYRKGKLYYKTVTKKVTNTVIY